MARAPANDLRLQPFDHGIAALLTADDQIAGYLATILGQFRTPFRPLTPQQSVWWLVTWSDGRRERIEEDYAPWTIVEEVLNGYINLEVEPGRQVHFTIRRLAGPERDTAWSRFGILQDVSAYM